MSAAARWLEASDEVCAAALAGLSSCWATRFRALIGEQSPRDAVLLLLDRRNDAALLARMSRQTPVTLPGQWRLSLQNMRPHAIEERLGRAGVEVWLRNHPSYPKALIDDPEPPLVLFARGDAHSLNQRCVAIVGTRRATAYGRNIAKQLGADLTDAGIGIVSGLAIGIDGAAHDGVLSARGRPVGVVGSGLNVVYPRRHGALWARVGSEGLLLSEAALGMAPEPWRFPERNRIIAGLAEIVIVVESGEAGGSQLTVEAAVSRGLDVMAVPGPVSSTASAGTNRLLVDGAAPVLGADEVLIALGLGGTRYEKLQLFRPDDEPLSSDATAVLNNLDFAPTPTERLLGVVGLTPGRLAVALEELHARRLATGGGGWWNRLP
ncbi:MAG: DNA-protecting protein DprA [Actinobacteria bacterium]|nr:DNA-protecting protein DprA [Actinomycetota bacterium]